MAKKDIYKIDNYFITIATILLLIGGLGMLLDPGLWYEVTISQTYGDRTQSTYENKEGRTLDQIQSEKGSAYVVTERSFPTVRSIMAANGLVLLIIGMIYRSRENKIISVWNFLEKSGEARVRDIAISLGLSQDFILKHLKDINAQQQAAFIYDSGSDKIINTRLTNDFLVFVDCTNCGNKINQRVSLDLANPPRCSYCGTGVAAEQLNKIKLEVLQSLHRQVPELQTSNFNIVLFIVLLVFFWPGAVFYVIKKKSGN